MNHHASQFRPSHYRSHQGGPSSCPMYFTYLNRANAAASRANHYRRMGDRRRMVVWQRQAQQFRSLAQVEHAKCHSYGGYGAMYGAYGGCGHCGDSHSYGAGCGTFLRIAVKDPDKKMCILEKKIKRFEKCCVNGKCFLKSKKRQCRRLRKAQGELQTLLAAEGGPTTLATATDMAYQNVRTNIDQGENTLALAQAKTQRALMIAAVSGVGILTAVYLLRR